MEALLGVALGAGAVFLGAPTVVGILGFGSTGIAGGSTAAWMMSLSEGATQAGGIVATCQSIGAAGVAASSGVIGAAVGGAIAIAPRLHRRNDE